MPKRARPKHEWEVALEKAVAEREGPPVRSRGRPTPSIILHFASRMVLLRAQELAGPEATPKVLASFIVSQFPSELQTEAQMNAVKRWLRDPSRGVCPGVGPHLLEAMNL